MGPTTIISDRDAAERVRAEWDALAVMGGRPFCAPGWLLPWFDHCAPDGAELQVVAVRGGRGELLGIGPFFAQRGPAGVRRVRPLGAGTCQRVEPLSAPGREREVATAIASALAGAGTDVLTFEGIAASSPWPALLRETWPGPGTPRLGRRRSSVALCVDLSHRSFDDWFMAKTSHFRQRLRKCRKTLTARGGATRLTSANTLQADLDAFIRLHRERWAQRGGSHALTPAVERMLGGAGRELPVGSRLRLSSVELDGRPIASSLVLVAGGEAGYWLNGFDEGHGSLSPSRLGILAVIEDAFALGATRLDLGEGDFEYKRRFADCEETLHWLWLAAPPRKARALASLLPGQVRREASERLDAETKERIRALGRRVAHANMRRPDAGHLPQPTGRPAVPPRAPAAPAAARHRDPEMA